MKATWVFTRPVFAVTLAIALVTQVKAAKIDVVDGLSPGQKAVLIRGPINPGDDDRFYQLTKGVERASVFLESPGGAVDAGISIGAEIAMRGFTTLVLDGDGCHSVCAVIWVSGARRYMSPNANIGVHAAYRVSGSAAPAESGVANAKIGAYLNELGLSRIAIEYFTLARPDEPLMPITPSIAQALDIDVFVQDGDRVITPAERPTPRRIARQVTELAGVGNNCAELFGVSPDGLRVQAEDILRNGHDLFGGTTFVPLLPEYAEVAKAGMRDLGIVQWCFTAEARLRRDGIGTGIVGPSYDCGKAATDTELAICASPDLWAMDRAVSNLYFIFRRAAASVERTAFLEGQRAWLVRRNACGGDRACLMERYSSRLFDMGF